MLKIFYTSQYTPNTFGSDAYTYFLSIREGEYEKNLVRNIPPQLNVSRIVRRREVIQHALAFQYIIDQVVCHDNPLSESIILETHRILTRDIDAPGGTPWQEYAGKYRCIPVHAGSTNFVAPRFVSRKMKELIQEFNEDITKAEKNALSRPFHACGQVL